MCGICGAVTVDPNENRGKGVIVREMGRLLAHRGPDDRGFYGDSFSDLAVRRLSIIDIEGGKQKKTDDLGIRRTGM